MRDRAPSCWRPKGVPQAGLEARLGVRVSILSSLFVVVVASTYFSEPPPRGDWIYLLTDRVPSNRRLQSPPGRTGSLARIHITIVGGLFVVVIASTGVLALVPWSVRGL